MTKNFLAEIISIIMLIICITIPVSAIDMQRNQSKIEGTDIPYEYYEKIKIQLPGTQCHLTFNHINANYVKFNDENENGLTTYRVSFLEQGGIIMSDTYIYLCDFYEDAMHYSSGEAELFENEFEEVVHPSNMDVRVMRIYVAKNGEIGGIGATSDNYNEYLCKFEIVMGRGIDAPNVKYSNDLLVKWYPNGDENYPVPEMKRLDLAQFNENEVKANYKKTKSVIPNTNLQYNYYDNVTVQLPGTNYSFTLNKVNQQYTNFVNSDGVTVYRVTLLEPDSSIIFNQDSHGAMETYFPNDYGCGDDILEKGYVVDSSIYNDCVVDFGFYVYSDGRVGGAKPQTFDGVKYKFEFRTGRAFESGNSKFSPDLMDNSKWTNKEPLEKVKSDVADFVINGTIEHFNEWVYQNGSYYYYDEKGNMAKGWKTIGGVYYYFDHSGKMLTGWQTIEGISYYFNKWGGMVTGWQYIDGHYYYFNEWGNMVTGWKNIDGTYYYFTEWGNMVTGWKWVDGHYYYFNEWGNMVTGWKNINGHYYYFNEWGNMVTGWKNIDGHYYYFNEWGNMVTGWKNIDGTYYYFNEWGNMVTGWQYIDGTYYYFNEWGNMVTGWKYIDGTYYYFNEWGNMVTGWKWVDGYCYYFYSWGGMAHDTYIDGSYVSSYGIWVK